MLFFDGAAAAIGAFQLRRRGAALLAGAALIGLSAHPVSAAETRTYVVSWFTQAMDSQEDDCPGGTNPAIDEIVNRGRIAGKPVNAYTHPAAGTKGGKTAQNGSPN